MGSFSRSTKDPNRVGPPPSPSSRRRSRRSSGLVGALEPGQELLELLPDLLPGGERLVLGEEVGPGLLGLLEGVVLPLQGLDDGKSFYQIIYTNRYVSSSGARTGFYRLIHIQFEASLAS